MDHEKSAGDVDNKESRINNDANVTEEKPMEKSGILVRVWKSVELSPGQVLIMLKGAMPPIIVLSAYQATAWADKFTTIGYLSAIMSLLGMPIMPRAKFIQTMTLNILFVCVGTAVALLAMYCSVKARQHTTSRAEPTSTGASGSQQATTFNSSSSTVSAIWLFVLIYIANTVRAQRPQLQFPVIIFSILVVVASCYSVLFSTIAQIESFANRLIQAFLTGFGISTGVSLFILPTTSRQIVEMQMGGFIKLTMGSLAAHQSYFAKVSEYRRKAETKEWSKIETEELSEEAGIMKRLLGEASGLFSKINAENVFAKREIAYGKLEPEDYKKLTDLLRKILMPVAGMTTFLDIVNSIKEMNVRKLKMADSEETAEAIQRLEFEEWNDVMARNNDPFLDLTKAMQAGLQHVLFVLEMDKKPKKSKDVEEKGDMPVPGENTFASHLEKVLRDFSEQRKVTLQEWCERKGITLPATFWSDLKHSISMKDLQKHEKDIRRSHNQRQLYLILYVQYLNWAIAQSILDLVRWADSKVEDGTMKKRRLILPKTSRFLKWAKSLFAVEADEAGEGYETTTGDSPQIYAGDAYRRRKDPEHLPPANVFEKITNPLRRIPHFLASEESAFGFRVACAMMSLAILNFLKPTQDFFTRQRGLWAVIMIAISMSSHTGQSTFGYLMRILGTTIAMCTSLILWYMGGQNTAAILVLLYFFSLPGLYIMIKFPKFAPVAMISMVTPILIIGYELQVRKLGVKVATSNEQPAYPIYELAPYRLAAVVAGLGVAFIWTYFPYPVTTRLTLRKQVGSSIYLLANYYSCVHTTASMRLNSSVKLSDEHKKGTQAYQLRKARQKCFRKIITLMTQANESLALTKLEPTFGGKFPRQTYEELLTSLRHIFNYINLITYATNAFTQDQQVFFSSSVTTTASSSSISSTSEEESAWLSSFRAFATRTLTTTLLPHTTTSHLCLLSTSLSTSSPLPPYLSTSISDPQHPMYDHHDTDDGTDTTTNNPSPISSDPQLLSISHLNEPCYAAFAVLQIARMCLQEEVAKTVELVRTLVGEVDFSWHVVDSDVTVGEGETTTTKKKKSGKAD